MTIQPRQLIREMSLYEAPEEDRAQFVRLDFNENTVGFARLLPGTLAPEPNIYPEYQRAISMFARTFGVTEERLLLTNGSDEALSLIAQTFIEPGVDCAVTSTPTFSMIGRSLTLAGAELIEVPVLRHFEFDVANLEDTIALRKPRVAIFASPDNPTGSLLPLSTVRGWLQRFPDTLFVIDEAYTEYAGQTALPFTSEFDNLLVTRTLSKAWALAGLRLGLILGPETLLRPIKAVRLPYSVNSAAVRAAAALLPERERVEECARQTMERKGYVIDQLRERGFAVVAGTANFFLLDLGADATRFCDYLKERGILVRNRSNGERQGSLLWGMVRITVGTASENELLLSAIDEFAAAEPAPAMRQSTLVGSLVAATSSGGKPAAGTAGRVKRGSSPAEAQTRDRESTGRTGSFSRNSKETQVEIKVNIDDTAKENGINTPLPFFSHMLDAFACHGRISLNIDGTGDIEVDPHHFIEDTGIVLGKAIKNALGGFSGIVRAGCFSFPMDGTIAAVAIDLCGRSNLVWNVRFGYHTVGNLDPNLFREFFKGLVDGLGATIHVNVPYSDNDHHSVEAIFKALGRALNSATRRLDDGTTLSTKGMFDQE